MSRLLRPLCVAALALLPVLLHARPALPTRSRAAFAPDILGEWRLVFSRNPARCPTTIRHFGWTRRAHIIRIFHTVIEMDGERCIDPGPAEGRRFRRFRLYESSDVNSRIRNQTGPRVSTRLLNLLTSTGPNINARLAANKLHERYFVGFEVKDRLCNGSVLFPAGTTGFLIRPFKRDIKVKKVDVPLTVGKKWLIMVPLYKRTSCVYESVLNSDDEKNNPPEASTEAEIGDDGNGGSDGESPETVPTTPAPGNDLQASSSVDDQCFPSAARVRLHDGSSVPMSKLSVGDKVQVGPDEFSEVFMFTHKIESVASQFMRITTDTGEVLTLTPGHYIYINDTLVMAANVRRGDVLTLGDGQRARVERVGIVTASGLHNPQTLHGDIVVDGIRVSTYTTAMEPSVAHGMLSPLRVLYRMLSRDPSAGLLNKGLRRPLALTCLGMSSS